MLCVEGRRSCETNLDGIEKKDVQDEILSLKRIIEHGNEREMCMFSANRDCN